MTQTPYAFMLAFTASAVIGSARHTGAAGVEDGVADRGRDHGHRRLADAGRLLAIGDDADRDFRASGLIRSGV